MATPEPQLKAAALCPTHITGFFEIRDSASDPLRRGSRGAGVNLTKEVQTEVETVPGAGIRTLINGQRSRRQGVEEGGGEAARARRGFARSRGPSRDSGTGRERIRHQRRRGDRRGHGRVGGARSGLTSLEAYQLAHSAEVELRTGLGTVLGQSCGGLEVREKEGAPGIGTVFQIPLSGKHTVVALHNGPMLTSEFLSNPEYRKRINEIGGAYSDEICRKRDLGTFLNLAHDFSMRLGLSEQYLRVMNNARSHGYLLGMAMFGHTLFTIVRENETDGAGPADEEGMEGRPGHRLLSGDRERKAGRIAMRLEIPPDHPRAESLRTRERLIHQLEAWSCRRRRPDRPWEGGGLRLSARRGDDGSSAGGDAGRGRISSSCQAAGDIRQRQRRGVGARGSSSSSRRRPEPHWR